MSKHQSNRRKSYGRRQHEVAERRHRDDQPNPVEPDFDDLAPTVMANRLAFLDTQTTRLHYALGD